MNRNKDMKVVETGITDNGQIQLLMTQKKESETRTLAAALLDARFLFHHQYSFGVVATIVERTDAAHNKMVECISQWIDERKVFHLKYCQVRELIESTYAEHNSTLGITFHCTKTM
jgi:hypothetical protein